MDSIIDINFNFLLFESKITNLLHSYNVSKEKFCEGTETEDFIIDKGLELIDQIDFCLSMINYRLSLIDYEYMEDKIHNKNKLKKERFELSKKITWYNRLKDSIEDECNKINIGEFDFGDEPDFEE